MSSVLLSRGDFIEADVASAGTCDIGATSSLKVRITGTTTITSFGTAHNRIRLGRFAGILTLTYNATGLILPGATNITTAAGDTFFATSDPSGNWTVRHYNRANGKSIIAPAFSELTAKPTTLAGYGITDSFMVVREQFFSASGTYTPNANMLYCLIECIGGGGGGGGVAGSATAARASGGGGAGSYAAIVKTAANIGASKAVTIGAAGAGGTAGTNDGSAGGDTSVGTLCIGKGGSGGQSAVNGGRGGLGGVAGTGTIATPAAPGGSGVSNSITTTQPFSGKGGDSIWGGGGLGETSVGAATAGNAAPGYGGGGSGAVALAVAANAAGGAGKAGAVKITEFCSA